MINASLKKYEGRQGFFPVSINCKQDTFFTTDQLPAAAAFIRANSRKNLYSTMATFQSGNRCLANISEITGHLIDIDSHIQTPTPEELTELKTLLLAEMRAGVLPYGNIKDTGRGIQVEIVLKAGSGTDIAKFNLIQEALLLKFEQVLAGFGSFTLYGVEKGLTIDKAVKNANRLSRIIGTLNTKAGRKCRSLYATAKEYTQEDLLKKYGLQITAKNGKTVKLEALADATPERILEATGQERKAFKGYGNYTAATLRGARIQDLFSLIKKRNKAGQAEGYRENLLYILAYLFREQMATAEEIAEELLKINQEFIKPLNRADVIKHARYAIQGQQRYFSNKTIIALLDITPAERKDFKTVITASESRKRRNERYYAETKQMNAAAKAYKLEEVRQLKAKGWNNTQIAKAVRLSRRTLQRWHTSGKL